MNLKQFLENEVKPALGCTEPGAVALASATAARHIGCEVESIHVEMSGSIFKNGVNVGVPGANGGTGNLLAAALGAAVGNPALGLRSLSGITPVDVEKARAGATVGIVRLGGGTPKQAEIAIASLVASVMGMTCDGGKGSCALKVSTAAGEAYICAMLALNGAGVNRTQGLLKPDLRYVAHVLGEISDRGLTDMDQIMIDIMQRG